MVYDLIILGAGAAGMTASIYASRYKINHLIFGDKLGGQFVDAHLIENYPGFISIDGFGLMTKFREHVESYGLKVRQEKIGGIEKRVGSDSHKDSLKGSSPTPLVEAPPQRSLLYESSSPDQDSPSTLINAPTFASESIFEVLTEGGERVQAKTLILAMGARHRVLNVPGEENYLGRGVSYCSTCDAPLFKGKIVAVVGGGNSAVTAALHLSEFATKVYLIHRGERLEKAEPIWVESLNKKENVVSIFNAQVKDIFGVAGPSDLRLPESSPPTPGVGTDLVKGVVLDKAFEGSTRLAVEGVFIEVGLVPAISLANQLGVECDPAGYLKATGDLRTNVVGVFAAGDLVKQSDVPQLRQIITSAGQGAVAAASVYAFLKQKKPAPDWGRVQS